MPQAKACGYKGLCRFIAKAVNGYRFCHLLNIHKAKCKNG